MTLPYHLRLRLYEMEKRRLQQMQLTPDQYQEAIKALARRYGL